jgi:demethylspheroidene O-methyltransferase
MSGRAGLIGAIPTAAHWTDTPLRWRDRLLASPRFQRWAQRFPPTRWVARRRAAALFDLMAGFVYSQVLLACVQLRLFDLLAQRGPLSVAALAPLCGLSPEATERVVLAAVALRLLEARTGQRYGLGPLGAPMVGNAGLAALVVHHAPLYRDLAEPLALLRGGSLHGHDRAHEQPGDHLGGQPGDQAHRGMPSAGLAGFWPYAGASAPAELAEPGVAPYSEVMALSQPWVAEQVLQAYPLARHRCLLDVGGGEGVFACVAAARAPHLAVQVFDLPAVAERARQRFAAAGLAGRAQAFGGDFLRDELPRGADVVSLVRVAHDHDDARVLRLLAAVLRALPPDGTLLLAEPLAGTRGAEAMGDAYFGFYLWAMGRGQPRRVERLRAMLEASGFDRVRLHATAMPLQTRLISARRPA